MNQTVVSWVETQQQKAWGCRHSRHSKDKCNNRKNDMVGNEISSFDAFLICKQLSVKELFKKYLIQILFFNMKQQKGYNFMSIVKLKIILKIYY